MRRKEHAAKRKAVETGGLDAAAAGAAKRQRMWWEEEIAHGRRGRDDGGGGPMAEDEVNDAEYYRAEVRTLLQCAAPSAPSQPEIADKSASTMCERLSDLALLP